MKKKLIKLATILLVVVMLAGVLMPIAASASGTWRQDSGRWWFQRADSSYARGGWHFIGGEWYFFDNAGWMRTGWVRDGALWYFLRPSGAMATGWIRDGGAYYWLQSNGVMVTGTVTIGGVSHTFASDGRWLGGGPGVAVPGAPVPGPTAPVPGPGAGQGGWRQESGRWWFQFLDGSFARGWLQVGGAWYFFDGAGWMQTGWVQDGAWWYWMHPSGAMATGTVNIGGVPHRFAADGRWLDGPGAQLPTLPGLPGTNRPGAGTAARPAELVGRWSNETGAADPATYVFNADGRGSTDGTPMRWWVSGSTLVICTTETCPENCTHTRQYGFALGHGNVMLHLQRTGTTRVITYVLN